MIHTHACTHARTHTRAHTCHTLSSVPMVQALWAAGIWEGLLRLDALSSRFKVKPFSSYCAHRYILELSPFACANPVGVTVCRVCVFLWSADHF